MWTRIPHCFLLFLSILVLSTFLLSQNPSPQSDARAIALAQQSIAALTSGVAVSDVTLTGNATWIAGSDNEIGPAALQAKGTGESRIDLNLSGGTRTEIRNDSSGLPQGETIAPNGVRQLWAEHNCWTNASWFFPALSVLGATTDPTVIFVYKGQEIRNGSAVQHIQTFRYVGGKSAWATTVTGRASTADIYLDATSLLPVAFTFNSHPDDDALTDISIEIDFTNYQSIKGVQVPLHVQKLISGGLALDIVMASVTLNTGLADTQFSIQ